MKPVEQTVKEEKPDMKNVEILEGKARQEEGLKKAVHEQTKTAEKDVKGKIREEEALEAIRAKEEQLAKEEKRLRELEAKTEEEKLQKRLDLEKLEKEKEWFLIVQNLIIKHIEEERRQEAIEKRRKAHRARHKDEDSLKELQDLMEKGMTKAINAFSDNDQEKEAEAKKAEAKKPVVKETTKEVLKADPVRSL